MAGRVRRLGRDELDDALAVINAAAERYRGVIPEPADTEPYMPRAELEAAFCEMAFFGVDTEGLAGVIGLEEQADVTLVRHLYVRPDVQRRGLGTRLLEAALDRAESSTVLVGTWAAADWAVDFYASRGFENLGTDASLLETYWDVPTHQREASIVLRYEA